MTARAAWRWCAAAGAVAFFCSWLFGRVPGLIACGPTGGLGAIIAFEFVASPADVASLFGAQPCTSTLVRAQTIGLLLDEFGFIPAYTTFLVMGAWAAGRRNALTLAVIAALAFAGISDEIEGALLYAILRDLPGKPWLVDLLWWPVHIKFALLAIGTAGIGALLLSTKRLPAIAPAVVIGVAGLLALKGLTEIPGGAMMSSFAIAWVTLLAVALIGSFWPSVFWAARAGQPPDQG